MKNVKIVKWLQCGAALHLNIVLMFQVENAPFSMFNVQYSSREKRRYHYILSAICVNDSQLTTHYSH
jgi:hypothetical protein